MYSDDILLALNVCTNEAIAVIMVWLKMIGLALAKHKKDPEGHYNAFICKLLH